MAKGQKARPRGEWAESTRKKHSAWNKENRINLSASVPKSVGDSFREYCKDHGKSVSAVLAEYVRDVLRGSGHIPTDPDENQE